MVTKSNLYFTGAIALFRLSKWTIYNIQVDIIMDKSIVAAEKGDLGAISNCALHNLFWEHLGLKSIVARQLLGVSVLGWQSSLIIKVYWVCHIKWHPKYVVVGSAEEPWNWCIEGEAKMQLDEKFEVIGWF